MCTKGNSSQSLLWAGGPIIILWAKTVIGVLLKKNVLRMKMNCLRDKGIALEM